MAKLRTKYVGLNVNQVIRAEAGCYMVDAVGQLHGYVPIEQLKDQHGNPVVDKAEYQRGLRPQQVAKMAAKWNPFACKAVVVGLRPDGEMRIVDGQQETGAHIKMGLKLVWCRIVPDSNAKLEAGIFGDSNTQSVVNSNTKFRALLRAGRAEQLAVNGIVVKHGFRINLKKGSGGDGPQIIKSVAVLEKLYDDGVLDDVLEVVKTCFKVGYEVDQYALEGQFLVALGEVILKDQLTISKMVRAFKKRSAESLFRNAQEKAMGARRGDNSLKANLMLVMRRFVTIAA